MPAFIRQGFNSGAEQSGVTGRTVCQAHCRNRGFGCHRTEVLAGSRISRKLPEEGRRHQKGDFAMEYMCEFMEDGLSVFSRDLVEAALDDSVKPLVFPPMEKMSSWR